MTTALRPAGLLAPLMLAVVCQAVGAAPVCAADEVMDSVMYTDPDIPVARVVKVFPPRLTTLWLRALERPEDDLKCQAAATIALAHRRGMPGLETTVTPLLRTLDQPEQHPTVRLAAAHALITLDARQAAPSLFGHAQTDGIAMRNLVEPALGRWDYGPMRTVWLERLKQPGPPHPTLSPRGGEGGVRGRAWLLAIQGLAMVREPKVVPRLRELTLSPITDPIIRLEAARALGLLQTTGLEKDAERLAAEQAALGKVAQVAAASLLRKHRSNQAATLLQRLAVEADPAAAAIALEALLEDDPHRLLALMPQLVASSDVAVRTQAVEAHRRCPLREHVPLVAELLDDPHPQVRQGARQALLEVARQADQNAAVRREATRLLATQRWRALEQATILLTLLDHKPAAPRLVELLRFERPEVFVAAAWGLRKLAVPQTLPDQLREIERRWQQSLKPQPNSPRKAIDWQVAQLAQSLGRAKYDPAAAVLRRFVPMQSNIGPESRAAAVWALGLIHQQAPPPDLVEELIGRLCAETFSDLEDMRVRRMCAIALGRMKAKEGVDALRMYYPGKLSVEPFPNACGWALQEITGELLPTSETVEVVQTGWFLEPTD